MKEEFERQYRKMMINSYYGAFNVHNGSIVVWNKYTDLNIIKLVDKFIVNVGYANVYISLTYYSTIYIELKNNKLEYTVNYLSKKKFNDYHDKQYNKMVKDTDDVLNDIKKLSFDELENLTKSTKGITKYNL